MTGRFPGAIFLSLTLHALVAGLMFFFAFVAREPQPETTKIFELVAGEGDNFMATKAPALGEPNALKVETPPARPPAPVEKAAEIPQPEPPAPVIPVPAAPVEKPLPKPVDLSKQIRRKIDRAEAKTKAAIEKERVAEQKKFTKAEFDKANKAKATAAAKPPGPVKVANVKTEGIREGVEGGFKENKIGGAGGKALVVDDGPIMDKYFALLQQRLRGALQKPPGLSDTLVTLVEVRLNANGSLTGARITKTSGSSEFDAAVMAAIAATQMPERPDKKSEVLTIPFNMKEQG